jgi:hypothetical protein
MVIDKQPELLGDQYSLCATDHMQLAKNTTDM